MSEITFYRQNNKGKTIEEHRNNFMNMNQSVGKMFPQVESHLRLLLISPASSCEAEWSFSALRRLKTWLRSTMPQKRLNHVMVCHVHNNKLAKMDTVKLSENSLAGLLLLEREFLGHSLIFKWLVYYQGFYFVSCFLIKLFKLTWWQMYYWFAC